MKGIGLTKKVQRAPGVAERKPDAGKQMWAKALVAFAYAALLYSAISDFIVGLVKGIASTL